MRSLALASSSVSRPWPDMTTLHASCVELGGAGVLIRGASGAGKSHLVLALLEAANLRGEPASLVADDRVILEMRDGRLRARAPEALAGLIERWGFGIERMPHAPSSPLALVVDIVERSQLRRMPDEAERQTEVAGTVLPRIAVSNDIAFSVPLIRAALSRAGKQSEP